MALFRPYPRFQSIYSCHERLLGERLLGGFLIWAFAGAR